MADNKNLSVQEILAACRRVDGGGVSSPAESTAAQPAAAGPSASEPVSVEKASVEQKPAEKKDAKQMSVADMLAAARGEKVGGASSAPPAKSEQVGGAGGDAPAAGPKKDPKQMSVADMLAAARGEQGAAPKGAPAPKAKPAAAAKAPAAKAAPKAAAPSAKTGPMDTSSILAAARGVAKPGPISKAEAAAKAKGGDKVAPAKPVAPPMPVRPEYARPVVTAVAQPDRRSVMSIWFGSMLAIGFVSLTMVSGLWGLIVARFFFPNLLIEPPSRFKVGFPGDFSAGAVETKFKAQFGVWVVNAEYEGVQQIVALKTVCTHLGCTPNWLEAEQKFKCPCHGSGFYKEGINFEGPAPRPLERYAIKLADDGQIEVDKSKTFQEELGQWGDAASFVPV